MASADVAAADDGSLVSYVMLMGFHHTLGPQVDLSVPALPPTQKASTVVGATPYALPDEWRFLPFYALPDGIHHRDSDYSYFLLDAVADDAIEASVPVYGVSFYRQIQASELAARTADITRSSVQKAVVVLARQPLFGAIRSKLEIVTAALFNERDFTRTDILGEFRLSISRMRLASQDDAQLIYAGTSPRAQLMLLGSKLLSLVKCILLERKVIAFTTGSAARLSTFVLSVATLIPGLVHSLGTGTVSFHTFPGAGTKAHWAAHGLPLSVYSHGLFQPYFSLMQLDELTTAASAFVGCNNLVIRQSKTVGTDVIIDLDTGAVEIADSALSAAVQPSPSDKRFLNALLDAVQRTWHPSEAAPVGVAAGADSADAAAEPAAPDWEGSDEWVRQQFHLYVCALLATAHSQLVAPASEAPPAAPADAQPPSPQRSRSTSTASESSTPPPPPAFALSDFGARFVAGWRATRSFAAWRAVAEAGKLAPSTPPGHPWHVDPMQLRLAQYAADSPLTRMLTERARRTASVIGSNISSTVQTLNEQMRQVDLGHVQQSIASTATEGLKMVGSTITNVRSSIGGFLKRRREQQQQRQREEDASSSASSMSLPADDVPQTHEPHAETIPFTLP